ncbi:MAG: hypothetical protein DRP11_00910 [Candidatus Aenigmatarchaeota archaeon]|nr:MAG: hypothetical protein DRP11_00910 [Candidatus Aenigmarchaeota archaeon]
MKSRLLSLDTKRALKFLEERGFFRMSEEERRRLEETTPFTSRLTEEDVRSGVWYRLAKRKFEELLRRGYDSRTAAEIAKRYADEHVDEVLRRIESR